MNVKLKKEQKIKVCEASALYPIMKNILLRENKYSRNREHFWVVGFDAAKTILYIELISIGSMTLTVVDPKEVFRVAILKLATYLILIHNHPFRSLNPSDADIQVTKQLINGAKIVGLAVLDHLIINTEDFYSFFAEGVFEALKNSERNLELKTYLKLNQCKKRAPLN